MSTVYDVADLAGVSTATVSRVIHGSPLVHPDTQQRVRAAIEVLGFVPDGSAQGLSRRRKDIIGLAALERGTDEIDIEEAGQLFVDEIVHAVEAVLRGTECSLLLTFGQSGEQFQRRVWSLSGKVDGLLVAEEIMPASRLRALPRDDHNRDAPGQRAQPARGHDLLGHEQPVDLAGQRPDAPLELLAGLAERQQQRTLGATQYRLDRVHDLVHEQLAGFFDVDLVGAAFQGGEPDDVLPPPAQPLGRPVGHEPEHLDGRADTLLGCRGAPGASRG